MDPAGKRPEVRPTAQPRLADVLGMERFVGVLRHVLVATAVDIDVELLSHRSGCPEVMRRFFTEVLFHLVHADIVVVDTNLPELTGKPFGDGRRLRILHPAADGDTRVMWQVELLLPGGDFLFVDEDAQQPGFFTGLAAAFVGIGQVLPDAFFGAGEIAPLELEGFSILAGQRGDDRIAGSRLLANPEIRTEIAVPIQPQLRPLVPQQGALAVELDARHTANLHGFDGVAHRRKRALGVVDIAVSTAAVFVLFVTVKLDQPAGVPPGQELRIGIGIHVLTRVEVDVAIPANNLANQVIHLGISLVVIIPSVGEGHEVECHRHLFALVRTAISAKSPIGVEALLVDSQLLLVMIFCIRLHRNVELMAKLVHDQVPAIDLLALLLVTTQTAVRHGESPAIARTIEDVPQLRAPVLEFLKIAQLAALVQEPAEPGGFIINHHLPRRAWRRTCREPDTLL